MAAQVSRVKQINPAAKVFGYRNLVKALPWFSTVRAKLEDARYAGFFLAFNGSAPGAYHVPDCAAENASKCSVFYHDQEQTPAVPTPAAPHPDGSCGGSVCDCGEQPCGEYLFDHRNGSMLREWIVNELILGPTGVGDAAAPSGAGSPSAAAAAFAGLAGLGCGGSLGPSTHPCLTR